VLTRIVKAKIMKKRERHTTQVGNIVNTVPLSKSDKGMLGFVITFSDGSMQNKIIDYSAEEYHEAIKQINALHKKMLARHRS